MGRAHENPIEALHPGPRHARAAFGTAPGAEVGEGLSRISEVLSFLGIDPVSGSGLETTADGDAPFGIRGKPKLGVSGAMDWCRKHAGAEVHYWKPGETIDLRHEVDGMRVYVLGPPTDAKRLFKDSPTKKGRETYDHDRSLASEVATAFFGANVATPDASPRRPTDLAPFDRKYRIHLSEAEAATFFKTHYFGNGGGQDDGWRRIADASAFALQRDGDTNNTSLALAFEIAEPGAGDVLLFPGDAQVGNWESWHLDAEGRVRTWAVDGRPVTAADLLARTVVYKVGHHGSHNATLRALGLELIVHPSTVMAIPREMELHPNSTATSRTKRIGPAPRPARRTGRIAV